MVQVLLQAFISSPNTVLQCIYLLPSSRESRWSSSCDGVVSFGVWDMGYKRQPPMHEIVLEVLEGRKKFHLALLLGHPYHFKVLGCWVNIIIKLIF